MIKSSLFNAMDIESSSAVRENLADALGVIGGYLVTHNSWPELLPQLFSYLQNPNATKID